MIRVPSGRFFSALDIEILWRMAEYRFLAHRDKPFKLKSGIMSNVYVYGREDLTDHPDLEWLAGNCIARNIWENALSGDRQHCLIGIPTAGTALAQCAAMASWQLVMCGGVEGSVICHRVMREALKTHGDHPSWVNGEPDPVRHTYWGVDNVATNGDSKIETAEKLAQQGYPVKQMGWFIFVDRQQGAVERLKRLGFERLVVAYNLLDITFAFGELGLWPKSAVQAVEEEIKAHQALTKG